MQAWKDIESAYGKTVRASFATLSPEPVASASLGQVYRGVLIDALGGGEVAVKVQRPRILADVALDLYLMRQAAILSRRLPQVSERPNIPNTCIDSLTPGSAREVEALH